MKKRIVKLLSFFLMTLLLLGTLNGCGSSSKGNLSGTDLAKLLLANQRLDSELLTSSANSVLGTNDSADIGSILSNSHFNSIAGRFNFPFLYKLGTFTKNGNVCQWSDFPNYSNYNSFFQSYLISVEGTIKNSSMLIDHVKEYIKITDVWVTDGSYGTLLIVDGTSETLYSLEKDYFGICKRYINESGQNVYEYYSTNFGSSDNTYLRMKLIPDYCYEFSMSRKGSDDSLHLVMEKTRGYWNMFAITAFTEGYNIQNMAKFDDASYIYEYRINANASGPEYSLLHVLSPDGSYDILDPSEGNITIYPSGFNGIKALQIIAEEHQISHSHDYTMEHYVLELDGEYSCTGVKSADIVLMDGTVLEAASNRAPEEQPEEDRREEGRPGEEPPVEETPFVSFDYAVVHSVSEANFGQINFRVEGNSMAERLTNLNNYLNSLGITCKTNFNSIINYANNGEILMNQFTSAYKWDGYGISNSSECNAFVQNFISKNMEMDSIYEEVKDIESVSRRSVDTSLDLSSMVFSELAQITMGNVTLEESNIIVKDMSITVTDKTYLDANGNYTIQLGLAEPVTNDDGTTSYDPCSVLPFDSDNLVYTTYTEGTDLVLTQNASFDINEILEPCNTQVVAFVVNQEGIRISEVTPVLFSATYEVQTTYPLVNLKITTDATNKMTFEYQYNNDILLEIEEPKASYSYQDIYDILVNGVITHGEFTSDMAITTAVDDELSQWITVSMKDTINSGIYRMAYTKNTEDGIITGYVYITI